MPIACSLRYFGASAWYKGGSDVWEGIDTLRSHIVYTVRLVNRAKKSSALLTWNAQASRLYSWALPRESRLMGICFKSQIDRVRVVSWLYIRSLGPTNWMLGRCLGLLSSQWFIISSAKYTSASVDSWPLPGVLGLAYVRSKVYIYLLLIATWSYRYHMTYPWALPRDLGARTRACLMPKLAL